MTVSDDLYEGSIGSYSVFLWPDEALELLEEMLSRMNCHDPRDNISVRGVNATIKKILSLVRTVEMDDDIL